MALSQEQIAEQQRALLKRARKPVRARGLVAGPAERMNRLEAAYAEHLLSRMIDGDVADFEFAALKFRLANRSWYTPDFLVTRPDGTLELHEVKGHMQDDAAVKLRLMPRLWWRFRLFVVRRARRGSWTIEERTG
ncbi:MAG: DUF1064 domain-containing protein [Planctomycetota bacterium]